MLAFLRSTILSKAVMAISGAIWVGFAIGHLSGHFLLFGGPQAYNGYAQGLRDLGPLLWIARIVLLLSFFLHSFSGIWLTRRNSAARPVGYAMKKPLLSTLSSRYMAVSGLLLLTFVLYHLAHFTFGVVYAQYCTGEFILQDGRTVHDAYSMVVGSFQHPVISITYILFMVAFGMHLHHAIRSIFQTLGFNHPKYNAVIAKFGKGLATLLTLGYISIPIFVLLGLLATITGGH